MSTANPILAVFSIDFDAPAASQTLLTRSRPCARPSRIDLGHDQPSQDVNLRPIPIAHPTPSAPTPYPNPTTKMTIEQAVAQGVILGMGNPLLDISATVPDDVLSKYGLEPNNAILAEDKHSPLYSELAAMAGVSYVAGGATQNSIRVAHWMLQSAGVTSYFGAIGDDDFGKTMNSCCDEDGVNVQYFVNGEVPTGTCAVVITGKNRSLVANLSAANTYPKSHLMEKEQWSVVEKASIFYTAGFFLTVSPDSMVAVGEHAAADGKTMCFNLSAPFLMQVPPFFEAMKRLLPYVDICFGNETEAATLSEAMGWDTKDLTVIATKLAQSEKKTVRPRTVVFTHGASPTVVVVADATRVWSVNEYPVIPIKADDIVDTNGAGDAFVGGFLAGLAKGIPIADCVAYGNCGANVIIQESGCTCPGKPTLPC